MRSTLKVREVGVSSDQPLFSQMMRTGRLRAAAKANPSWVEPWLNAPSPMETTTTFPFFEATLAIATPQAMGTPAPTMEFSPMKSRPGAIMYAEPPRPPLTPMLRWQISPKTSVSERPEPIHALGKLQQSGQDCLNGQGFRQAPPPGRRKNVPSR